MKVKLAVLADYANTSKDGKLNIMGIFSRIQSTHFPARHLSCHLVISCSVNEFDVGKSFPYKIRMVDADGSVILTMNGGVRVGEGAPARDVNLDLQINEIVFPKPGDYEFIIEVADDKFSVPVVLDQMMPPPSAN